MQTLSVYGGKNFSQAFLNKFVHEYDYSKQRRHNLSFDTTDKFRKEPVDLIDDVQVVGRNLPPYPPQYAGIQQQQNLTANEMYKLFGWYAPASPKNRWRDSKKDGQNDNDYYDDSSENRILKKIGRKN